MNHCRSTKILSIGDEPAELDSGQRPNQGHSPKKIIGQLTAGQSPRLTSGGIAVAIAPLTLKAARVLEEGITSGGIAVAIAPQTLKAARVLEEGITSGGKAVSAMQWPRVRLGVGESHQWHADLGLSATDDF